MWSLESSLPSSSMSSSGVQISSALGLVSNAARQVARRSGRKWSSELRIAIVPQSRAALATKRLRATCAPAFSWASTSTPCEENDLATSRLSSAEPSSRIRMRSGRRVLSENRLDCFLQVMTVVVGGDDDSDALRIGPRNSGIRSSHCPICIWFRHQRFL